MAWQISAALLTKIARQGSVSTLSRSHLWRIQYGSSLLTTRVFSNATPPKFPLTFRNRRSLHSFNSLDRRKRSIFRRFTTDGVVLGLVVTNVAVYLLWKFANRVFMVKNFVLTVEHIKDGQLQTLITCTFSHMDMFHLITNNLGLYFFGTSIGQNFGQKYLLKLYLGGAVVGSIFYLVYRAFLAPPLQGRLKGISNLLMPSQGASAPVSAIMLLDVLLFPSKTMLLLGCFIVGSDIFRIFKGDARISASTHLGGATVAAFAWLRYRKRRYVLF